MSASVKTRAVNPPPTNQVLDGIAGYRLRRLQTVWLAHWGQSIRRQGLEVSPMQGGLLMMIRDNPGIGHSALARLLSIEAPTLSQSLTPLVAGGFVDRHRTKGDGRAVALKLTQAGAEAVEIVVACSKSHEDALLAQLSEKERSNFMDLLGKALNSACAALEDSISEIK